MLLNFGEVFLGISLRCVYKGNGRVKTVLKQNPYITAQSRVTYCPAPYNTYSSYTAEMFNRSS